MKNSLALEVCFFFQAEDGIRDLTVTGVQTCALPICHIALRLLDQDSAAKLRVSWDPRPARGNSNSGGRTRLSSERRNFRCPFFCASLESSARLLELKPPRLPKTPLLQLAERDSRCSTLSGLN